jgi:hypothetical protein
MDSKNVKCDIDDLIKRKKDYKFAWNNSLKTLMTEIPDFDYVFDEAVSILKIYSNL